MKILVDCDIIHCNEWRVINMSFDDVSGRLGYIMFSGIFEYIKSIDSKENILIAQEMIEYYRKTWILSTTHLQQKLDEKIEELG